MVMPCGAGACALLLVWVVMVVVVVVVVMIVMIVMIVTAVSRGVRSGCGGHQVAA